MGGIELGRLRGASRRGSARERCQPSRDGLLVVGTLIHAYVSKAPQRNWSLALASGAGDADGVSDQVLPTRGPAHVVEETHLNLRRLATILALIGVVIWGLRLIFADSYWPLIPWETLLWFAIALTVAALSVWPIRALAGLSLGLAAAQTLFLFGWYVMEIPTLQ